MGSPPRRRRGVLSREILKARRFYAPDHRHASLHAARGRSISRRRRNVDEVIFRELSRGHSIVPVADADSRLRAVTRRRDDDASQFHRWYAGRQEEFLKPRTIFRESSGDEVSPKDIQGIIVREIILLFFVIIRTYMLLKFYA